MPALYRFADETGFEITCYSNLKRYAWSVLQIGEPAEEKPSCERMPPDTENYDHPFTSQALNCTLMLESIISFIEDRSDEHVQFASTLATDSVVLFMDALEHGGATYKEDLTSNLETRALKNELALQSADRSFVGEITAPMSEQAFQRLHSRASGQPSLWKN